MIKPKRLQPGDTVAVVSLSKGMLGEPMFIHKYDIAKARLESMGYHVKPMKNALRGIDYLYHHPEKRAEDLMEAFLDPEIAMVVNSIGGDDSIRLLPYVDFRVLHDNPKIFTGFSDTTSVHFMMRKAGLVSYYGFSLMNQLAEYVKINPYTENAMEKTLIHPVDTWEIPASPYCSFDKDKIRWGVEHQNEETPRFPYEGYTLVQGKGKVTGELLGGCIDVFPELLATPLWPMGDEWNDKILLLETSESDMSEDMLTWLLRGMQAQGIFDRIKGIVVGLPAFPEKIPVYKEVYKKVVGLEAAKPDLPILLGINIGHAYPTGILPLGLRYEINSDEKSFRLMEKATV